MNCDMIISNFKFTKVSQNTYQRTLCTNIARESPYHPVGWNLVKTVAMVTDIGLLYPQDVPILVKNKTILLLKVKMKKTTASWSRRNTKYVEYLIWKWIRLEMKTIFSPPYTVNIIMFTL